MCSDNIQLSHVALSIRENGGHCLRSLFTMETAKHYELLGKKCQS
jgi:hypothetical protein